MIPKIIHYCWFGGNPKSKLILKCIDSWKAICPDFEIRCWTEADFDIGSVPFVKHAHDLNKWAFVADYVRLHALNSIGGIYLDTDVQMLRPFEEKWMKHSFFSAHEYHPGIFDDQSKGEGRVLPDGSRDPKTSHVEGFGILSAVMAAAPAHPFTKKCLAHYQDLSFSDEKTEINNLIIGGLITKFAEPYGYLYRNSEQRLSEDMLILPADTFVGNSVHLTADSYAIHLANGSWHDRNQYDSFVFNMRNNHPSIYPAVAFLDKVLRKIKFV